MSKMRLLEIYDEMKDTMSETIKIDRGQVLEIVVAELLRKYFFNVECRDHEKAELFKNTLRYYISESKLKEIIIERNKQ